MLREPISSPRIFSRKFREFKECEFFFSRIVKFWSGGRNNFHDAESLIFKDPNLLFEGRFRNQGQARKRFALKAKSIASGIKGSRVSFEIRLSMGLPVLHRKGLLVLLFASPDNSALRRRAKGNKYSIIEGTRIPIHF